MKTRKPLINAKTQKAVLSRVIAGAPANMLQADGEYWLSHPKELREGLTFLSRHLSLSWLEEIVEREREILRSFFANSHRLSFEAALDFFSTTLEGLGKDRVAAYRGYGLEPHILPGMRFLLEIEPRMPHWYLSQRSLGQLRCQDANGLLVNVSILESSGVVALVDTREKPNREFNGGQMFESDNLLGPILKVWRQCKGYIDLGPHSTRFSIRWLDKAWEDIRGELKKRPEFKGVSWRFEFYPEFRYLAQTIRPNDDKTDTGVWFEEYYGELREGSVPQRRLYGGQSFSGGLNSCLEADIDGNYIDVAIRPLGVLANLPELS